MANFKKSIVILAVLLLPIWGHSSNDMLQVGEDLALEPELKEVQKQTMTLTITINSIYVVRMKDVPLKGYLEVYGILGKREKRIALDKSEGEISIDLSKGLYVLKAEKITQKIRVQ